ncbi:MAG: HlyD family efflux transporter periplasmic adaptor subunit [Chitinophagaceae bacterium]
MPRIFPAEVLQQSVYTWLPRVQVQSQVIYVTVVGAVIAALLAAIFVKVDVSVNVAGIVRPVTERTELRSLAGATINTVPVKEGDHVDAGQVLLTLQQDMTDNKLDQAGYELSKRETYIHDLSLLIRGAGPSRLSSGLYKEQYLNFQASIAEKRAVLEKLRSDFGMYSKMYDEKVVTKKEYVEKKYAFEQAKAQYNALMAEQNARWQQDLEHYRIESKQWQTGHKQLKKEKDLLTIKAPVTGTVQQFIGRYPGGTVQVGELLGYVSPDSGMIAECYVSPADIGYIRAGMPVKFQVDAFNYNSWGLVSGKVTAVDNDFSMVNNMPVFKVKCSLDKTTLHLSNGASGNLKKGMTLQCRFILARRRLMQLLYEKTDNWLNPNNVQKTAAE